MQLIQKCVQNCTKEWLNQKKKHCSFEIRQTNAWCVSEKFLQTWNFSVPHNFITDDLQSSLSHRFCRSLAISALQIKFDVVCKFFYFLNSLLGQHNESVKEEKFSLPSSIFGCFFPGQLWTSYLALYLSKSSLSTSSPSTTSTLTYVCTRAGPKWSCTVGHAWTIAAISDTTPLPQPDWLQKGRPQTSNSFCNNFLLSRNDKTVHNTPHSKRWDFFYRGLFLFVVVTKASSACVILYAGMGPGTKSGRFSKFTHTSTNGTSCNTTETHFQQNIKKSPGNIRGFFVLFLFVFFCGKSWAFEPRIKCQSFSFLQVQAVVKHLGEVAASNDDQDNNADVITLGC